uniref:Uncharacterized protein n=1 Tax=Anguilla anguilla TaxID=7936 RepID=A0A0E9RAL4_ANGAN
MTGRKRLHTQSQHNTITWDRFWTHVNLK